jgi:hypothetical protein
MMFSLYATRSYPAAGLVHLFPMRRFVIILYWLGGTIGRRGQRPPLLYNPPSFLTMFLGLA